MNRFLKYLLLFFIPVFVGLAVVERLFRQIPNDYSFKNEWLSNNAGSIRVLNMGSSHAFYGIEPSQFSCKAFNAAHVSQSIKYDHFIFSKFVNEMDSLEVLVLPVSYGSFLGFGPENGIEDWRVKYYSIYYGCKYHRFEPKYNLEVYNGLQFDKVWNSILGKANHRTCNDLGRGTSYTIENRTEDWKESGEIAAKRHTKDIIDTTILLKNKKMIEEMICICKQKNASVILLTTPTYQTYRDNLNNKQLALTFEYCEGFADRYDNVYYLNLLSDDRFGEEDFFDADHLNEFGAAKLTGILQQTIDSLGILQN